MLAYPIKHFSQGTYVLTRFNMKPSACKELENNLGINEQVLRHLLVRQENIQTKRPGLITPVPQAFQAAPAPAAPPATPAAPPAPVA
jgi:hypothetical protein